MTDESSFLRAICSTPACDTTRLAFADFLDEAAGRATDRARFIRLQIELAHLESERGWVPSVDDALKWGAERTQMLFDVNNAERDGKLRDLRYLERQLLEGDDCRNVVEWFHSPVFRDFIGVYRDKPRISLEPKGNGVVRCEPRRGFLDEIECSTDAFLACADALLWHEGQTALGSQFVIDPICSMCSGTGKVLGDDELDETCACVQLISSRVPRPFPLTAQPITLVNLTDTPQCGQGWAHRHIEVRPRTNSAQFDYTIGGQLRLGCTVPPGKDTTAAVLEHEWPGVAFTYPGQPRLVACGDGSLPAEGWSGHVEKNHVYIENPFDVVGTRKTVRDQDSLFLTCSVPLAHFPARLPTGLGHRFKGVRGTLIGAPMAPFEVPSAILTRCTHGANNTAYLEAVALGEWSGR